MSEKPLTEAKCPKCGRKTTAPWGDEDFFCHHCKMAFSTQDDGDFGYGRPDKVAERREKERLGKLIQKQRRGRL